jgi:hypothetical protein
MFDEGGDEEVFVVGEPNGDGGGVAGFDCVVLGGSLEDGGLLVGDGGLVGADFGGTSGGAEVGGTTGGEVGGTTGGEVGGTTGVGVGGTTGVGVDGATEVGGGGELDEGVAEGDALVVVGSYMLAANRIP